MITAGIDMGAKTIKVVILKDGQIIGRGNVFSGFETAESAEEAMRLALDEAGLTLKDIQTIRGHLEALDVHDVVWFVQYDLQAGGGAHGLRR